jgi:hypothetical protein
MSMKSEELLVWYLALLRKNVREDASRLTPMTLVETDHQLVQEIVTGSEQEQRLHSQRIATLLKERNKHTRLLNNVIQILSAIGLCAAAAILLFFLRLQLS